MYTPTYPNIIAIVVATEIAITDFQSISKLQNNKSTFIRNSSLHSSLFNCIFSENALDLVRIELIKLVF